MATIAAVLPSPVSLQIFLLILCGSCWWGIHGLAPQREFDYFKLALQWPPTFCQRTRYCCSSNACCRGANSPSEFTIHGLWPDYNDGTWPGCCDGHVFDQKAISSLHDEMMKYWPSLSCGSPSNCHGGKGSFWAHEWEKHGTCSSPVVRDELSYFSTALSLYSSHNVTQILDDAGYAPSNSEKYPLGGIITAIKNAFRATPSLECSNGAVKELHLCFHKDFEPRDCEIGSSFGGNTMVSRRSCPDYISLPVSVPSGFDQIDVEDPLAFAEI